MNSVKSRLVNPALLIAVAGLTAGANAQLVFHPVALTGTDGVYGPNLGAGVMFVYNGSGQFGAVPTINNNGVVGFRGNVNMTGTPDGAYMGAGAGNTNVGLSGGARPGGGTYPTGTSNFAQFLINDSGDWSARIGASTGVVSSVGGNSARLAYGTDVAPGTGSATWATSAVASGMPYFNSAGQTAFIGNLATGSGTPPVTISAPNNNASGLWVGTPTGLNLMLRQNDTSTLLDAGQAAGESRVGSFQTASMALNGNGEYVVSANLQGANIITSTSNTGQNSGAILTNRGGSMSVIARVGAPAPDATGAFGSEVYRSNGSSGVTSSAIGFNDAGHVAWMGTVRAATGTTQTGTVLFSDNNGTLRQIARSATPMGTIYNPDGSVNTTLGAANFAGFGAPVINANDLVVFQASGNNVASTILTLDTANRMTAIAVSGTVAIPNGAPLGGDALFSSFSSNIDVNRWGQMVFTSTLSGAGISGGPGGNNSAIWGYDPVLGIQLLARTQDAFTDALGNTHTIAAIGGSVLTGGQDGRQNCLNDQGVAAITLYFTDGTAGVYTVAIPAPGAAAGLALAGLAGLRRRRRS